MQHCAVIFIGVFLFYLTNCIRQFWVHSSSSFTVENCSFYCNYRLNTVSVGGSKEKNRCIHSSQEIQQVLFLLPAEMIFIIKCKGLLDRNMSLFIWVRKNLEVYKYWWNNGSAILSNNFFYLRLFSFVPINKSKNDTNNYCDEESDGIILWIPPIGAVLFPEASFTLSNKWLRVFRQKVKVLCSRHWCA